VVTYPSRTRFTSTWFSPYPVANLFLITRLRGRHMILSNFTYVAVVLNEYIVRYFIKLTSSSMLSNPSPVGLGLSLNGTFTELPRTLLTSFLFHTVGIDTIINCNSFKVWLATDFLHLTNTGALTKWQSVLQMKRTFFTLLKLAHAIGSLMPSDPLLKEGLHNVNIRVVKCTDPALSLSPSIRF